MNERSITNLRFYCVFLYILYNPACTTKDIENETKINPSTLRNMIAQLKTKGFIKSVDDENDKSNKQLKRQLYFVNDEITKEVNTGIE